MATPLFFGYVVDAAVKGSMGESGSKPQDILWPSHNALLPMYFVQVVAWIVSA